MCAYNGLIDGLMPLIVSTESYIRKVRDLIEDGLSLRRLFLSGSSDIFDLYKSKKSGCRLTDEWNYM